MDYPSDPEYRLSEGEFTDGDAGLGLLASRDKAGHYNAITKEIIAVIEAAGLTPAEAEHNQMAAAINTMLGQTYFSEVGLASINTLDLSSYKFAYFQYHTTPSDQGGGFLYHDEADGSTSSNGETVFVDQAGSRYKRHTSAVKAPKVVDVFVAYGQSNAAGGLDGTTGKYTVPTGYGYLWDEDTNQLVHLDDPTREDEQDKASAWPAFGAEWARKTGRPAVIINMAKGGRAVDELKPGAGNNFYENMRDETLACIASLQGSGYRINSCSMIWVQGENDSADMTPAGAYIDDLDAIHEQLFLDVDEYNDLYISRLGYNWLHDPDYTQWAAFLARSVMRACLGRVRWHVCFSDAGRYTRSNGLLSPSDYVHYSQMGYNLMGIEMVANILEEREYGTATGRLIMYDELHDLIIPFDSMNGGSSPSDMPKLVRTLSWLPYLEPIHWEDRGLLIRGSTRLQDKDGNTRVSISPTTGNLELRSADGNFIVAIADGAVQLSAGGSNKFTLMPDGTIRLPGAPTAAAGLATNTVWNDAGTLKLA